MAGQFGPLLRRFRLRDSLTQEALAEKAQLGVRTVRRLESGERADPRMGTVEALADALGLSPAERIELLAATGDHSVANPPAVPAGDDRLAEAASRLATELRGQLRREEEQRQIHDPLPLPVRWHSAPTELIDSWANICRVGPGESAGPLDLDGELDQIVATYRRIPSRRLVVLGRAGSGKTILTIRFVLGLLDASSPGDPVPVIFSLGSWHPGTTLLRDWLIEQLLRDHPGLTAPGPSGSTLAAALVESGRILPVLDGFDEIASGLHQPALAALNAITLPLVVTSRVDEYRVAVESTDVLTSAGAVVLTDLTATDLANYLPRTTRRTGVVWGVMASFEAPVDISSVVGPMDLLNTNRRTVAVQSLLFGLMTCAGYTVVVGALHDAWGYGLPYGLVLGLAVSLGFASLTAWGAWMVFARVWLPVNGRVPWGLPGFLEDAYRRGVLRRSGAVYQFRHARLQDHLTHAYRRRF